MPSKGIPLLSHNPTYSLDAFLDKDGAFKLGGRLHNSSLSNSIKNLAIIPIDHRITQLMIAHHHERMKRQGKGLMKTATGFQESTWQQHPTFVNASPVDGPEKPTKKQRMADLNPERVESSPPFSFCSRDLGPFLTKHGRKENKRYVLLFTCLSSSGSVNEAQERSINYVTTFCKLLFYQCLLILRYFYFVFISQLKVN